MSAVGAPVARAERWLGCASPFGLVLPDASPTPSTMYAPRGVCLTDDALMVADTVPADLRGTAFGVFHLVSGIALLLASLIAGALWDSLGHQGTIMAGAVFAGLATLGFGLKRKLP